MNREWMATNSVCPGGSQTSSHRKGLKAALHKKGGKERGGDGIQEMWNPIWEGGKGNFQIDCP